MGRQGRQRKRWEDKADRGRGGKTRKTEEEVGRQGRQRKRWEDKADGGKGGKTRQTEEEVGRQGRQRKRWEDNIREWTGLEFAKSKRAVVSSEKWRKLVAKSTVVPQRPSRLRDR